MYTVIGKRLGLEDECDNIADTLLGNCYAEGIIGVAVRLMPDGIILQKNLGVCYETYRAQLVELTEQTKGVATNQKKPIPFPPFAKSEFHKSTGEEIQRFVGFHTHRYTPWDLVKKPIGGG
jgi:hypothetical protein